MANTPKKIKDPTEAALSAIQDALSARDAAEAEAASPAPVQVPPVEESSSEPTWRAMPVATPDEEPRQPEEQSLLRRAANDDRESIGQILRTLQRRPGHTSYVTATVFAGLWVLAGLVLGWMYLPELQSALGPTGLTAPVLAMLGVVFFVPIIFFYVLAHMAWRSQELRLITQSMAEVAMRLAEPET
ncbi:MAG TPA: methyl-accepting chemotaxis protein, partial [Xanthobacteraceae bacterium]|nr:methyl-accepting chemotaxis protein [Xanthobacteraceae bacterium]